MKKDYTHKAQLKSLLCMCSNKADRRFTPTFIKFIYKNQDEDLFFDLDSDGIYNCPSGQVGHYFRFEEEDLRYITKIKPSVEIPEAPFWVETGSDRPAMVERDVVGYFVEAKNSSHQKLGIKNRFVSDEITKWLNDDTWKIVPEPKKIEIITTDSREYCPECGDSMISCTRGVPSVGSCERGHKWDRSTVDYKIPYSEPKKEMRPYTDEELEEFVFSNKWVTRPAWASYCRVDKIVYEDGILKGVDCNSAKYSKKDFLRLFTDRHGNKFEKEVNS